MAIDARRLLGFPEGNALGNSGLPQRVPEDAHRDNPAPLTSAHECPRTLNPLAPSYRIGDIWTTKRTNGILSSSELHPVGALRASPLLIRFRGQAIEEGCRSPMRRHVRSNEPDVIDRQPPVSNCRLAWCRVLLEDQS